VRREQAQQMDIRVRGKTELPAPLRRKYAETSGQIVQNDDTNPGRDLSTPSDRLDLTTVHPSIVPRVIQRTP
jgi:hypothetical protein